MPSPIGVVRGITLDVADLDRAAAFWGAVLGLEVIDSYDTYVWLEDVAPGIRLILQRVPEAKSTKNRAHLDVSSPDPQALIERVEALGGSRISDVEDPAYSLTVMADPDGNEFCVTRRLSSALAAGTKMP